MGWFFFYFFNFSSQFNTYSFKLKYDPMDVTTHCKIYFREKNAMC